MSNQIKVYVSHSIRGKKGVNATDEDMQKNNQLAIAFGGQLRGCWPGVKFYVPGDHDEFVIVAYSNKMLTEKQILDVDCEIVKGCNFIIAFTPDGYLSRGMRVEIEYACSNGIPVIEVARLDETGIANINRQLQDLMR